MIMNEVIAFLESHPLMLVFICSITGYLMGSISFARIVYNKVTNGKDLEFYSEPIANTDETFDSDFVSATLINKRIGAKYGCITSVADMLKVAVPTIIAKLLFTSEPYFLTIPIFGMLGHYLPVYHNFIGGRGETIMLGTMLVVDWFGTLAVNLVSTILGFITGNVVVLRYAGYFLMIFWLWHRYDYRYGLFMFLMYSLFWFSMRKEIALLIKLRKRGLWNDTNEQLSEKMFMGRGLGRAIDNYSLPSLFKKFRNRNLEEK